MLIVPIAAADRRLELPDHDRIERVRIDWRLQGCAPTPTVHAQHAVRPHPSDNQCSTHTITSASSTGSRAPAYRYQSFMLCASARVARRGVGGRAAPADRPPAVVDISRGRHCRPRLRGRYRCAQAASRGGVFTAVPKRKKKKRRGRGGEEKEERVRQLSQRLYPATCHLLPSRARAPQPDRMQNCMKIGSESQNFPPATGGASRPARPSKDQDARRARSSRARGRDNCARAIDQRARRIRGGGARNYEWRRDGDGG